ncbi:MAG: dephospho-CoA kinase [Xenococcaceae cyanobacterium]
MKKRRAIGLTGGISTGKSTVSGYLANRYHLNILDADVYAREAVEANSSVFQEIVKRYGNRVLTIDRILDRKALGEIIFNDPQQKIWLEKQIHPYVRDRLVEEIAKLETETVVLAIPLLFEANMTDLVSEIWVVYCDEKQQIERLMQRDRLSESQAQARINSQLPLAQKIASADVVLDNSSSLEFLYRQIDDAFKEIGNRD